MKKQTGKVNYDQILNHIGQFGPWQKRIHFLLWLVSAAGGLAVVVFSFTAYNLGYRCRNPYCDGFNQEVFSNETKIETPGLCQYYSVGKLDFPFSVQIHTLGNFKNCRESPGNGQ